MEKEKRIRGGTINSSPDETGWKKYGVKPGVRDGEEKEYLIQSPEAGNQYFKVECRDASGNTASSNVIQVSIGGAAAFSPNTPDFETDQLYNDVSRIMDSLNTQSAAVKDFMSSLGISTDLESFLIEIKRLNKNYNNLQYREFSDADLQLEKQNLLKRLEGIKSKAPQSINIFDHP